MFRLNVFWILIIPTIAGSAPKVTVGQISIRSELVSGPTLPLQAIAVRYTLSHDPAGEWPEDQPNTMPFGKIRKPGTLELFDLCGPLDSGRSIGLDPTSIRYVIRLGEGEQVSFLACMGAEWRVSGQDSTYRPLFEQPGTYALATCNYAKDPIVFKPSHLVEITIATPMAEDALIYQMLKKDRVTAAMMLSTYHIPDELCMKKLEELIAQHPNSSYADYARFALARGHLKSNLIGRVRTREEVEKAVLRYIESERKANPVGPRLTGIAIFFGNTFVPLRGRRRELAEILAIACEHNRHIPPEVIQEIVNLKWASHDEVERGHNLLESISNKDFPYYANVLILLRRLCKLRQPAKVVKITARLDEQFYDHFEWLDEIREEGISPADWRAFRVEAIEKKPDARK